ARVDQLAREVLGESYLHLRLERTAVDEDVAEGRVTVRSVLSRSGTDEHIELEGSGVGLVDAFFDAVVGRFASEFPSLKTIKVSDFGLGSGFDSSHGRQSDAMALATLRIRNSQDNEFTFTARAVSVTSASLRTVLDALTFFLNSERAYVQLHAALADARQRRRSDLVERFRSQMGTLVTATSYSEVIERLKRDGES
ncbi:MAG: alpha-isopropylmalate synthase regulatory domain-containing protein, partial [Myxococcota bacterium]